jgi:photosystem II stability/assembly factor-like uncharacterized protein
MIVMKLSARGWLKAIGAFCLSGGLVLAVSFPYLLYLLFSPRAPRVHAQPAGQLTWLKHLDVKPHVIAFSPEFSTDRLALLGTAREDREHGIWRSTDGGETWTKSSDGIPEGKEVDVYDIAFSPTFAQDQTVFASVHKQKVTVKEAASALFRSTDGGKTWEEVIMQGFPIRSDGRPLQDLIALSLSPDFAHDGTMFAVVATKGVYRSTDRGSTWQQVLVENANDVQAAPTFAQERLVAVATTSSGLLLSTDGGETWSPSAGGLEGVRNVKQVLFSRDFAQDRTILAMSPTEGIFLSRDAGASWENIARPPGNQLMTHVAATPTFASDRFLAYALLGGEIYLSEDLGLTWQATGSAELLARQVEGLFMPPDYARSRTLYASSIYNGLFRYYPVEGGSEAAAMATAVAVQATATAEAIPTVMARERQIREETLKETGCITYYIPPTIFLGIWALHRRRRGGKGGRW